MAIEAGEFFDGGTKMGVLTALGMMSGTSLDGVDAAIVKTDGENSIEVGTARHEPYTRALKVFVRRAVKAALEGREAAKDVEDAEAAVTRAHAEAAQALIKEAGIDVSELDVIGFHGQTILHRPASMTGGVGRTWQIGDGEKLAALTGVNVVSDFRTADVAAGGEGAPFAPIYHAARARAYAEETNSKGPIGVINLGGVANITFVDPKTGDLDLIAFDCGPGNGLIDEWMEEKTGEAMDKDGKAAATGDVDEDVLRLMLVNPYLKRPAPKSLDRYDFKLDPVKSLSLTNGAATLTAFSAACISRSLELLPCPPAVWIVAGGGRRNPVMMDQLRRRLNAEVLAAEDVGWRGDDLEAECFAYLAVRSLKGLPLSYPRTTGVSKPLTGGVLSRRLMGASA